MFKALSEHQGVCKRRRGAFAGYILTHGARRGGHQWKAHRLLLASRRLGKTRHRSVCEDRHRHEVVAGGAVYSAQAQLQGGSAGAKKLDVERRR